MQLATPSHLSPRPADQGFTLVELLAVIAIIAVLGALSLVGISRMRESAKASACLSHLRQIAAACQIYSS